MNENQFIAFILLLILSSSLLLGYGITKLGKYFYNRGKEKAYRFQNKMLRGR